MINGQLFNSRRVIQKLFIISTAIIMTYGVQTSSAQTKYKTWSDPNAPATAASAQSSGGVQKMVDELNKMVSEAERDKAAAPAFLHDLRALTRRYDVPWRIDLVNETFSDGDFTTNPTWRTTSGRWWVEKNFGLRAAFVDSTPQTNNSSQHNSNDDIGKQLFGAILNQALGGNQQKSNSGSSKPAKKSAKQAAIHLDRAITNAFSAQIEFTSWRNEGSFEVVLFQGSARSSGYRLFYRAGKSNGLELVRSSRYGTNAIQTYAQALNLEDKRTHILVWTRDRAGDMTVSVDDKKLMTVRDQSFNDPFNGISLVNHGGDYIIGKVAIKGTN